MSGDLFGSLDVRATTKQLADLAKAAGRRLLAFLTNEEALDLQAKGPRDFVTAADLASEAILLEGLDAILPQAHVVSEEGKTSGWRGEGIECLVDPLDGTTNFAHGHPFYSVSIGITIDGTPCIGVVYAPHSDELFTATLGHGAQLNGCSIRVSSTRTLADALLCAGISARLASVEIPAFERAWSRAHAVRHDGSAALDLAYVAAGRYDGFWEAELRPWDTAAGIVLVREAGGDVQGFANRAFDIREGSIIACNGSLTRELSRLIG